MTTAKTRHRGPASGGRGARRSFGPAREGPLFAAGLAIATLVAVSFLAWVVLPAGLAPLDLRIYLLGGHAVLHQQDLYSAQVRIRQYGFTYPPFAGLLFALPSLLPRTVAYVAMTALSVGCLALLLCWCGPGRWSALRLPLGGAAAAAGATPGWLRVLPLLPMLAFEPVRTTLWDGQINLVLAAMISYDVLWADPRGSRGAGVLTGLAAAVKLTPAIFVLYFLARRRYRATACSGAAFLAATALAGGLLPGDSGRYWFHQLLAGDGLGDVTRGSNHALLGLLLRLVGSGAATPVWVVLALAVTVGGLWLARRLERAGLAVFALGTVGLTGCLVSPVSWSHHWVWFLPCYAALVELRNVLQGPIRTWVSMTSATLAGYLVGINVVPTSLKNSNRVVSALDTYAYVVLCAALFLLAWQCARSIGVREVNAAEDGSAGQISRDPFHGAA